MRESKNLMETSVIISVKQDGTIRLPRKLREYAKIVGKARAVADARGILLVPADDFRATNNWAAVFGTKLQMRRKAVLDLSEVSLDGLWL